MGSNKIFSTNIEVRLRDLDAMGYVNNSVFFTYFEEGRKNFSKKFFKLSDRSEFTFIVAHINCNYLKPIRFNDNITLRMWVKNIGTKSFSFEYKLVDFSDESIVYATGESVQICYDYREDKSIEVSEAMRETLLKFRTPETV